MAITIAEEGFTTTGLMVTERNWLDVYPYANWGGNANLPVFQQGQQFIPQEILLRQVRLVQHCEPSSQPLFDLIRALALTLRFYHNVQVMTKACTADTDAYGTLPCKPARPCV